MKIAMLGASSHIARDLMVSFSQQSDVKLDLYGRGTTHLATWLSHHDLGKRYDVFDYSSFHVKKPYDVIFNFVGVTDPAQVVLAGASVVDIAQHYDDLALDYLHHHPETRYIYISSGAVYGEEFLEPARETHTLQATSAYGLSKVYAEKKHRQRWDLNIVDVRIFSYFSASLDLSKRFFMSDVLRALRDDDVLHVSRDNMYRDYVHPDDFYHLIQCVLSSTPMNQAIDCYSQQPIDKITLLEHMKHDFRLKIVYHDENPCGVNVTGMKQHYYSVNKRAESIGYKPSKTSLGGLLEEVSKFLERQRLLHTEI